MAADTLFDVVFQGEFLPEIDEAIAKQNLMGLFGLRDQQVEKILKSSSATLKKGVDEATAQKYAAALERAGLRVVLIEREGPPVTGASGPLSGRPKAHEMPGAREGSTDKMTKGPPGNDGPPTPPTVSEGQPSSIPFQFTGIGSEYFKIWLVNAVLSILTMGIYSAWAKVRRKQYFYGSTRIKGASFEYLADPVKILKGRIVVVIFFMAYSLISSFIPFLGPVLSLVFLFVLPWLVVRSLAFNACNSAVRNIRFRFHGTVWEAAKVYILWPLVAACTLGILFPYAFYRQKKFVVENTSYGTTMFTFSATSGDYYGVFISAVIPLFIGLAVVAGSGFLAPSLAVLTGVILYLYLFAFYSVKTTNLLFNASALASHRLHAELHIKDYMILVLTNTVAIALTMGLFHPWAKVRTARYKTEHLTLVPSGDLESFVAAEQDQVSALGDEMSDFMDFDFGI